MSGLTHLQQGLKSIRLKLLLLCVALFGYQLLFTILGASSEIYQEILKDMNDVPPMVEQMMGKGFFDAIVSYGIMAIGYIHPLLLVLLIVFIFMTFSQLLCSEISSGAIGFTLSKPLSRQRLFINICQLVFWGLVVMVLSGYLAVYCGIIIFHSKPMSLAPFTALSWNLFVLLFSIMGLLALLAAISDNSKQFLTRGGILLFLCYLLNLAAPIWRPLKFLLPINPFHYYRPLATLTGERMSPVLSFVLIIVSLLMTAGATVLFSRRDLSEG